MKKSIFLLLLLSSGVFANSQVSFPLEEGSIRKDLTPYLKIHEDKTGRMDIEDIRSAPFSTMGEPNMGYSSSRYWIQWTIKNPFAVDKEIILVYDSTVMDYLSLYTDSSDPLQETGDQVPFSNRSLDYRNPNFLLKIPANSEITYFLKISSQSTIPIRIEAFSLNTILDKITHEQIVYGMYYGWMLVMILYNLFLFVSARIKSYLFYVLFIFSLSMFQFILNGFGFQYLWPGSTYFANQSLLVFMILATLTGLLFSTHYLKTRQTMSWFYRIYQVMWAIGGLLLILSFILSYSLIIKLATVYAALAALVLLANGVLSYMREIRTAKIFLIAYSIFLIGVLFYTGKSLGWIPSNFLTNWTIQIGAAIQVALLSLGLADRIKELSSDLDSRLYELDATAKKLTSSENRFRQLFNGISDIIFVLDNEWNFIDINRSVTRHLGFKHTEIIGKNILEFIYKSNDIKDTYNRIFVMEKLEELHDTKNPVDFQAEFRQKFVMEPKELLIKLQYVQLDDRTEILGTASVIIEDILSRYLQKERISFSMDNYLRNVDIMSNKLTQHLAPFTDVNTILGLKTSLREIIINAIEHGNLNISFDEKTRAMQEGNYLQFIQARQEDPRYKDRMVTIDYVLDSKKVAYRITDQGKGFDHKKTLDTKMDKLNEEFVQHGRGILMTRDVFDIVEYNEKGNQVNLVKYFR